MGKYDSIIHLQRPPHPKEYPPMPMYKRAAQFIGFRALTGHEELIEETGRYVEQRRELDELEKAELDNRLRTIMITSDEMPLVTVEYFLQDHFKDGGEYVTHTGIVVKINPIAKEIFFADGMVIKAKDVIRIEGERDREMM